jgi:hypothetical protein
VAETAAHDEIVALGYRDHLQIQEYERQGVRCKYVVDPRTGDMEVVPEGTPQA